MKQIDFLVCVRCFTFNHAPYIKDAMDGFCMQKTSFPFVCVIVDDASTDGEPNVIRTYMGQHFNIDDKNVVRNVETDDYVMTFAQHKVNENCFFAVYYLKYNHYSIKKDKFPYFAEYHDNAKYIALCEGDDFWINPTKIQKQVEYLDSHENIGLCYTNFNILYNDSKKQEIALFSSNPQMFPKYYDSPEEFIYRGGYVCPPSWMIRKITHQKASNGIVDSLDGSFVSFVFFLVTSNVYCIDEVTTVYRVLNESASHSTSPEKLYMRARNLLETKIRLIEYFNLRKEYIDLCREKYYRDHMLFFIVNHKDEEFSILKSELKTLSKKETIIMTLSQSYIGRLLITLVYKWSKALNIQRKSFHY